MARNSASVILSLVCAALALTSVASDDNPLSSYEVVFDWKELDYQFPTPQTKDRLLESKEFIRENNVIAGVKVSGSRVFVTVPRWRSGVPSTLNYVSTNSPGVQDANGSRSPLLVPFPSWEMQQVGNCESFQYVQSMEIDQFNRMWVVDVGRVNIFSTSPDNRCPPKLVVIDLDNQDQIVHRYEFPSNVVSHSTNFLNDIVVGCATKEKCSAYITDASDSKLVVYNFEENRSWFVHHKTMIADPGALVIPILDGNYSFNANIDGIALSPKDTNFNRVYYSPLSSFHLYSVSTSVLQEAVNGVTLRDTDVVSHGRKSGQSDGLAMDSQGDLFYGLLPNNSVVYFNTSHGSVDNEVLLVQNNIDLQWPDTFGFDDKGYLYMATNRLQRFKTNSYDYTDVNFRVARVYIGSKSYLYSAHDKVTVPSVTVIPGSESSEKNPTNLDNDAPDKPVLVGLDNDSDKYKHTEHDRDVGDDGDDTDGNQMEHSHHDHGVTGHQHGTDEGDSRTLGDSNKVDQSSADSSAPKVNEHVPVVIFLTVLMFNPALVP